MTEAAQKAAQAAMDGSGSVPRIAPPGGSVTFEPNNLTKGVVGLAVSFIACVYATKKFRDYNVDSVKEALEATRS